MSRAACILAGAGYDVIDLNFACPVKKIKNKARGGHMLFDVDRGVAIMRAVRDALPNAALTVSLRRGFDDTAESEEKFFRIMETAWAPGFAAARVHARTVEQKYIGSAHWPFLTRVKREYPTRTILGSGDVFTAADAVRMYRRTGVDMVWIARGAIGNPWIFRDAQRLLENPDCDLKPPAISEQREALREHFAVAHQIHGESLASRRMRKMGIKYSRFHPQCADVKHDFIAVQSLRDWHTVLEKWYDKGGEGVWPPESAADEVNCCEAIA